MSVYLFDLGNTRLKYAPLRDDGAPGPVVVADHDGEKFAQEVEPSLPEFESACVASVVAEPLRLRLLDALTRRCRRISFARTERAFDGVRIAYAQPERLGVDRFLALLAAHARGAGPWLIAGVGTALTIDLLDARGAHRGGRIAPSPTLMRAALHARAPQLPATGGAYRDFADETEGALASGCIGAAVALIEQSLRHAEAELGAAPRLLLHGGGADQIAAHFAEPVRAANLVLEGLARWARCTA